MQSYSGNKSQLPNFNECWWDHWVLDGLICNGSGIFVGWLTLRYLKLRSFHWRGMWKIPTLKGKVKRVVQQFTPYSWMDYDWRPLESFKRWISVIAVTAMVLLAELNSFYLKFVLWLSPPHYINCLRVTFMLLAGAVSLRETYQYLDDPLCRQFGRQSWLMLAIIMTEFLLVLKFGHKTLTMPFPKHVIIMWTIGIGALTSWTLWNFFIKPYFWNSNDEKIAQKENSRATQRRNHVKLKQR